MAYATPDVYIEEISTFPPSVAEVETAIPAFIGHTEKAYEFQRDDLHNVPRLVKSLLEFQQYFGFGAPVVVTRVDLDENNVVSDKQIASSFHLYDSVRLFFKNGGGKCYIISVGNYQDPVESPRFETGLYTLRKKDEPTLILLPDAVKLESDSLYSLQQAALKQCAELQDRFCVFDLLEKKTSDNTFSWSKGVDEFRDKIGMQHLKYGAAYTPWLRTNLGQDVRYRDIKGKLRRGGVPITLSQLAPDSAVRDMITDLDNAVNNCTTIADDLEALADDSPSLKQRYQALRDALEAAPEDPSKLTAIFTFLYSIVSTVDGWLAALDVRDPQGANIIKDVETQIGNTLASTLADLAALDAEAEADIETATQIPASDSFDSAALNAAVSNVSASNNISGANDGELIAAGQSAAMRIFDRMNPVLSTLLASVKNYETHFEAELLQVHPVFAGVIRSLNQALTLAPPSGAVVGAYAQVDASRGVWKAPANVSLANVIEPSVLIDNVDQSTLNIDTVAGKSINAIRKFTGKGTLIWGARTLMGNDNEWRYVNVRRFFNMVEESVKKSTYWAVFEPNDANTWIKIKSMIENYLTQKWREGALQGSKADQAFFVNVGLGTTMTPQDVLEGRMNVEIGMAVVRPAEFIILKFSHKLPES